MATICEDLSLRQKCKPNGRVNPATGLGRGRRPIFCCLTCMERSKLSSGSTSAGMRSTTRMPIASRASTFPGLLVIRRTSVTLSCFKTSVGHSNLRQSGFYSNSKFSSTVSRPWSCNSSSRTWPSIRPSSRLRAGLHSQKTSGSCLPTSLEPGCECFPAVHFDFIWG